MLTSRPASRYLSAFFDNRFDPELYAPSPWFQSLAQERVLSVHSESADSRAHASINEQLSLVSTRPAYDMGILDRSWLMLFNEACADSPQDTPQLEHTDDSAPAGDDSASAFARASASADEYFDVKHVPASASSTSLNEQVGMLDSSAEPSEQQPSPSGAACPSAEDDECHITSVEQGARRPKSERRRGSKRTRKLLSISRPTIPKRALLLTRKKYEAIISSLELRCYARMLDLCRHTDGIVGIEFDESTVCDVCRQVRSNGFICHTIMNTP